MHLAFYMLFTNKISFNLIYYAHAVALIFFMLIGNEEQQNKSHMTNDPVKISPNWCFAWI